MNACGLVIFVFEKFLLVDRLSRDSSISYFSKSFIV